MLQVMIDCGCNVQVCDDSGRTPLHDACWTKNPDFELVEQILKMDMDLLFVSDIRDTLPLSYAPRVTWDHWLRFLESKKEVFWPKRNGSSLESEKVPQNPLTLAGPNTCPIVDPPNALPLAIATMVATGRLSPDEALSLVNEDEDDESSVELNPEDIDDDVLEDFVANLPSSADSLSGTEHEMTEILKTFGMSSRGHQTIRWSK
jgi:hypothetical protein